MRDELILMLLNFFHLSAVNKRKLSIAIAFIGRPPVVILDEPTLGLVSI